MQSEIGGRRGARRVVEHCQDVGVDGGITGRNSQKSAVYSIYNVKFLYNWLLSLLSGVGLSKIEVRLLYTFEHELPAARSKIEVLVSIFYFT